MTDNVKRFVIYILARHLFYIARKSGKSQPWSSNPILQQLPLNTEWQKENSGNGRQN